MKQNFIEEILKQAKKAQKRGEVPVGAIIVKNNKIIAKAHNLVEKKKDATMHAEILAIKKASKKLKNWRLIDCEMYVLLEPCNMCMNAIELSRIKKVYYLLPKNKNIIINNKKYELIEYNKNALNIIQDFFKKIR